MRKLEIEKYLKNPPNSWRKMFREQGISETPTINEVLYLLDKTAGSNQSGERETAKDLVPPENVREEAMKGIVLSYEHNYPSYNGIGLARAIQLATQPKIWEKSVERMRAFFARNKRYEELEGFGDDKNPSKSYMAYLNWGGKSALNWINSL